MKTVASVEIDRPIGEVFEYTITGVAEWSTVVVSDEVVEEKPGMVGTTFRTTTSEKGREMVFEGVVTDHRPPRGHAVSMVGQHFDIEAEYEFEDLGGRTRVTQRSEVRAKGFLKVLFALLGPLMAKPNRRAAEGELANLKRILEAEGSGSAT